MDKCKGYTGRKVVKYSNNSNENRSKIDPSFKSKRYRDKLRYEIKSLEALIPVDRTSLNRKLDSQTVFRLILAYFRSKQFFQVSQIEESLQKEGREEVTPDDKQLLQSLDGFIILLSSDGIILYVSDNVLQYIGFNQVDLLHRCIYGIVHPDDHNELQINLEQSLSPILISDFSILTSTEEAEICKPLSFICRMKYFNGSSAGYLKMHCSGKILHKPEVQTNSRSSNQMVYLFVHPFMHNDVDVLCNERKEKVFWSKHEMDLKIMEMDEKCKDILGYEASEVKNTSFYLLLHPEDLSTFSSCHKLLMESTEVQTIYFRMETKDKRWKWFQSRGKVLCKNSKKFSIVFSHCPLSEDDSTFIQQEAIIRHKYGIHDLQQKMTAYSNNKLWPVEEESFISQNHIGKFSMSPNRQADDLLLSLQSSTCPSSWHVFSDRHSPVLPSNHVAHKIMQQEKQRQFLEFKRQQSENILVNDLGNMGLTPVAFNTSTVPTSYHTDFHSSSMKYQESSSSAMPSTILYVPNTSNVYQSIPHNFNDSYQPIIPRYFHSNQNFNWPHNGPTHMLNHAEVPVYPFSNYMCPLHQQPLMAYNVRTDSRLPTTPHQLEPPLLPQKTPCVVATKLDLPTLGSKSPDIDDAVHMKIVEATPSIEEPTSHVDLPSIGSFLEYLNEV